MGIAFFDYVAALRESGLSGPTRSVAFWIAARCANGWPVARETVAADSGFSRATVTRAIAELREKRWLLSSQNWRQGNSYELNIPRVLSAQCELIKAQSEPVDNFLPAHSEPKGAQSEPIKAQSEPVNNFLPAHSEPTVGSERAFKGAHSEPTYIRTIQEQQEHFRARTPAPARTHAREGVAGTIKHSDLNQGLLWTWVRELEKVPEALAEVLKFRFYRIPDNKIDKDKFVTALLTSEALFEHFRPWFEQLKEEGRI